MAPVVLSLLLIFDKLLPFVVLRCFTHSVVIVIFFIILLLLHVNELVVNVFPLIDIYIIISTLDLYNNL